MNIAIHCGGMPFDGMSISEGKGLGGSESAGYYMAKELAALGHTVVMFTESQRTGVWDGVRYEWVGEHTKETPLGRRFHFGTQAPNDVMIIQRHPQAFSYEYNAKLKLWWLHDLALYRNAGLVQAHLHSIDQMLTVSEFHRNQVSEVYDINKDFITPTWNGVDYSMFEGLENLEREKNSLVFAARPERGLEPLVGKDGIMEKLPECHLYVCGYENTTSQMASFYKYLFQRCKELPNVTNLGALGKEQLYKLLAQSMLYVYPTTFEDTSCIMVLEANAAGTPFLAFKTAALPETCKGSGSKLLPLKKGKEDKNKFAHTVKCLLNDSAKWENLHEKAKNKKQSWASAAKQWDSLFKDLLKKKCDNKIRLHRHFERYSDIVPAVWDEATDETIPELSRKYKFYFENNYKEHLERYYKYEKDRGVIYGPESMVGNSRFECVSEKIGEINPKSLLDYGCAHGHFVMNLMKRYPDIRYFGVDINRSNIEAAKKWAMDDGATQEVADNLFLESSIEEGFELASKVDLLLASEILEHVPDPVKLMTDLKKYLNPDGYVIITVPYGAWEAVGYHEHPEWRSHLHHFERRDLYEIFGSQDEYKLLAVPNRGEYGHFVLTFKNSNTKFGCIDYNRKIVEQNPKETLSVCLIAKDAEYTIGKTLQSIELIADEIIVAIDETTTDETERICKKFGATILKIPSPIKIGFDKARNLSIENAIMDWIFWIDCDETLEHPLRMNKYLRQNCYDGYGIKQHHFAAEPAALFKTDYPVRLFRNNGNQEFFGVVHEHPEKGYDEGPGKITIIPDIAIMHMGYSTEEVRRKRFDRNWPLMRREWKAHPERKLTKFLWVRDLAHYIKYNLEENGGIITNKMIECADEMIIVWRDLLKMGETRLLIETIPFYSEAVNIKGNGIEYVFNLEATKFIEGIKLDDDPIIGRFASKEDVENLTKHLVDQKLKYFDDRYF